MIHAVGMAWAERHRGSDRVAMTFFGDGATSEGDFHEAMNFAGVYRLPVIFVCQNNHYAISTPRSRQTASDTIAQKAEAYGFRGHQVDGNDLLAVVAAARDAVESARRGGGPTLIEAVTFRVGAHTTADDPGRYRDASEENAWRALDPLDRVRSYLEATGEWDAAWQSELESAAAGEIEAAIGEAEALEPLTGGDLFEGMFASITPQLDHQRRLLEGEPHG